MNQQTQWKKKMKKEKKSVRQKIAKIVPSKLIFDVKNGKHEKKPLKSSLL